MQTRRLILLASGLAMLLPVTGYAQSLAEIQDLSPEERRTYMDSMSPDERTAMREKWRNEFAAVANILGVRIASPKTDARIVA